MFSFSAAYFLGREVLLPGLLIQRSDMLEIFIGELSMWMDQQMVVCRDAVEVVVFRSCGVLIRDAECMSVSGYHRGL